MSQNSISSKSVMVGMSNWAVLYSPVCTAIAQTPGISKYFCRLDKNANCIHHLLKVSCSKFANLSSRQRLSQTQSQNQLLLLQKHHRQQCIPSLSVSFSVSSCHTPTLLTFAHIFMTCSITEGERGDSSGSDSGGSFGRSRPRVYWPHRTGFQCIVTVSSCHCPCQLYLPGVIYALGCCSADASWRLLLLRPRQSARSLFPATTTTTTTQPVCDMKYSSVSSSSSSSFFCLCMYLFIGAHLFITVRLVRLCMYVCVLSNKFQLIYYYATALIMIDNDWMANSDMTL